MSNVTTKMNKTTKKIWDQLMDLFGGNTYIVAGLMGHMYALSELKTGLINGYNEAINHLSMEDFVHGRGTYGICQWRKWTSKQGLWNMARKEKKALGSLDIQLRFIKDELSEAEYEDLMKKLRKCKKVRDAVKLLADGYFYKGRTVRPSRIEKAIEHATVFHVAYTTKGNGISKKVVAKKPLKTDIKPKKVVVPIMENVEVHIADNFKSKIVGNLKCGTKYEYVMSNEKKNWHCINFEGKLRWVGGKNTKVINA